MFWAGLWWLLLLAGGESVDPAQAGSQCFEQLDFSCAAELLALAAGEEQEPERLKLILLRLAESRVALRRQEQAVEAFSRLLEIEPRFQLAENDPSPLLQEALEQARRLKIGPPPTTTAAPAPPADNPPPAQLDIAPASSAYGLDFSAGVPLLFGRDRDHLWPGGCFTLAFAWRLHPQAQAALAARYAFYPLRSRSGTLHLGAVLAWLGAWLETDRWRIGGSVGLGPAGYGLAGEEGRAALLLAGQIFTEWHLGRWRLGPALSPEWLITMNGGPFHSFTLALGVRLAREL